MLAIILSVWLSTEAAKPLSATITPHVCQAPCTVRITIRTIPHPQNRWIVVQVSGPQMFRSSMIPLAGEGAAHIQDVTYKEISAGDYQVLVILYRGTKEFSRDTQRLQVSGN